MEKYLDLLREIRSKGTFKPAARAGMPSTKSLFGYQYRFDLKQGFPIHTTKKMNFNNITTELLWFLRGDTNIKYLVDNGCNIWNEDAYNYYLKQSWHYKPSSPMSFEDFVERIKDGNIWTRDEYTLGDCGWQYGKLWRSWDYIGEPESMQSDELYPKKSIDQISELINGLRNNPESRRHILTALNPAHYNDLALFPCHTTVQFNCRPLYVQSNETEIEELTYKLDCHLYQRSCDVFLGVPYNTASYALLTHILAEICGYEVGDFIHSFGDVHIYENHEDAVTEQLSRTPTKLPKLIVFRRHETGSLPDHLEKYLTKRYSLDDFLNSLTKYDFSLENYSPQSSIKAKLSTGLK